MNCVHTPFLFRGIHSLIRNQLKWFSFSSFKSAAASLHPGLIVVSTATKHEGASCVFYIYLSIYRTLANKREGIHDRFSRSKALRNVQYGFVWRRREIYRCDPLKSNPDSGVAPLEKKTKVQNALATRHNYELASPNKRIDIIALFHLFSANTPAIIFFSSQKISKEAGAHLCVLSLLPLLLSTQKLIFSDVRLTQKFAS